MTSEQIEQSPGLPAPPTQPGQLGGTERPPSSWPTVIGIIAIVFGALGILGGVYGALSTRAAFFIEMGSTGVPFEDRPAQLEMMQQWTLGPAVGALVGAAVAILLLVAGIGLVNRRAWSVKACKVWAVLGIVVVVFGTIVGFATRETVMAQMQQDANMGPMESQFAMMGVAFGMCGWLLFGLALPVFVLIWFSRSKIKAEVAAWT